MHSGTTLLSNILSRNPEVYEYGGETLFYERQHLIRRVFPDLQDDDTLKRYVAFVVHNIQNTFDLQRAPSHEELGMSEVMFEAVLDRARQVRCYSTIFKEIFDFLAQRHNKKYWIDKTPSNIYYIDTIQKDMPEARFIEIVRDPRDVLASKKHRRRSVWRSERFKPEQRRLKHLEKAFDPVWDALSWKSAIRAGQAAKCRAKERIISVRYEELVSNPEVEAKKLCDYLGMPFMSGMLDLAYRNSALAENVRKRGISADSVGRWQHVLSLGERATCQWFLKKEILHLGYDYVPVRVRDRLKIPFFLVKSLGEFGVRLSRRWRLGGRDYLVDILRGYRRRLRELI